MTYQMFGRRFTQEEWESICTRCGLCCYEKFEERGQVVFTDVPCQYLDAENMCKVYKNRLEACEDCYEVTPEVVLEQDILPQDCGYIKLAAQLRMEQTPVTDPKDRARGERDGKAWKGQAGEKSREERLRAMKRSRGSR